MEHVLHIDGGGADGVPQEEPMSRAVVLGGGGGIGRVAVRSLAALEAPETFDEIVVADLRLEVAQEVVAAIGPRPGVSLRAVQVDATSPASLAAVIAGASVVVGCIGPFYRFGVPMLEAAIAAKVDYVDVCDDLAPTKQMLELDGKAKAAGITAVVFDRSGARYHGKVKVFADAAREAGLVF